MRRLRAAVWTAFAPRLFRGSYGVGGAAALCGDKAKARRYHANPVACRVRRDWRWSRC